MQNNFNDKQKPTASNYLSLALIVIAFIWLSNDDFQQDESIEQHRQETIASVRADATKEQRSEAAQGGEIVIARK